MTSRMPHVLSLTIRVWSHACASVGRRKSAAGKMQPMMPEVILMIACGGDKKLLEYFIFIVVIIVKTKFQEPNLK